MNISNFQTNIAPEITAKINQWLDTECTHTNRNILYRDLRWVSIKTYLKYYNNSDLEKYIASLNRGTFKRHVIINHLVKIFYLSMLKYNSVDLNISKDFRRNCYIARLKIFLNHTLQSLVVISESGKNESV